MTTQRVIGTATAICVMVGLVLGCVVLAGAAPARELMAYLPVLGIALLTWATYGREKLTTHG